MGRQKAVLCSNHLVFINVSQHELGVDIESRRPSLGKIEQVAWSTLSLKEEKAWLCFSESFSSSTKAGGGCSRDEAQSFCTGGVGCAWRRQGQAGLHKASNRGRIQGETYQGTF